MSDDAERCDRLEEQSRRLDAISKRLGSLESENHALRERDEEQNRRMERLRCRCRLIKAKTDCLAGGSADESGCGS